MSLLPQEVSLIVSSDPAAGAKNISANGSSFEISLEGGLNIPKDALNIQVSVPDSAIWWTIVNVQTGVNDRFVVYGDNNDGDDAALPTPIPYTQGTFTVTIPAGLYDLTALNESLARELENAGARITPEPLITLGADDATQKVEIRFNYTNVTLDLSQPRSPTILLGYNSTLLGPFGTIPYTELAPNVARFNSINYFLIHSDIISDGIRFNNSYNQTIAQVLIDKPAGSQIISTPFNPAKSSAQGLAGSKLSKIRFWLTDDQNNLVDTNSEFWSARILISYYTKI